MRKRKKYEVDNASTRVAMLSEYLEKENASNNSVQEEDDTQKKQKEWMKRSQALNAYFKSVDNYEVEETSTVNAESAPKSASRTSSTVNVKKTARKSTKRLNALI